MIRHNDNSIIEANQKFCGALKNSHRNSTQSRIKKIIKNFANTKVDGWKIMLNKLQPEQLSLLINLFQQVAKDCVQVGENRCIRILPGGLLHEIFTNTEYAEQFKNMPATNGLAEQSFGSLKHILKYNPNILLNRAEIIARLKTNKTFEWYEHVKKQIHYLQLKL